ncbi:MAG: PQQ-dependent sugar dehydrogenase [Myxococcota bacterium]
MDRAPRLIALTALATVTLLSAHLDAAAQRTIKTKDGPIHATRVAGGLAHPWGIAFLPDGRMLVTERPGRLRLIDGNGAVSPPLRGTPNVVVTDQGGLLDVALSPSFKADRFVYLTYAEPGEGGASTAVARGTLSAKENSIEGLAVIFRQTPKVEGPNHWGSRMVFAKDGKLFVTLGERFKFDPAQDTRTTFGAIVRIAADGSAPIDNPFFGKKDTRPEIWSHGHRNVQGAAIHPTTGVLWAHEFGPRGGDELNIIKAGKNYGWPLVSWGKHYDLRDIPDPPTRPDLEPPVKYWDPVISPSGMTFYTGDLFPKWRGNLLIGGLSAEAVVRLGLDGDKVVAEERIGMGERVRAVAQAPDGSIVVLTDDDDDGAVIRLTP